MDPVLRDEIFPSARVFCNPIFLHAFQNSPFRRFKDSKTLVDLQLKRDPSDVLALFASFPKNPSQSEYDEFMNLLFQQPEEESSVIHHVEPVDYDRMPPALVKRIQNLDGSLLDFICDLKVRWKQLCRVFMVEEGRRISGVRSSFISLPYPFFIPGGRFRECYYWDTLWIVKGLIASQMLDSAKGAVRNLLYLVETVGFVPNGNRVYYLNRSQPPLLAEAVRVVHDAIMDPVDRIKWLEEAVPSLDKEYKWFCATHSMSLLARNDNLSQHSLAIYHVETSQPRPESYKEDFTLKERHAQNHVTQWAEVEDGHDLYKNLASAAESGWDFSSRWTACGEGLETIHTCDIVPCCLNSVLLRAEKTLASFHNTLADAKEGVTIHESEKLEARFEEKHRLQAQHYEERAQARQKSIQDLLWNPQTGFWFDYDLTKSSHTTSISCAGVMPLWAGCEETWKLEDAEGFVHFVTQSSGLLGAGGLFCTTQPSPEQWDFPNCWPPLVEIVVEALEKLGKKFPKCGAQDAAVDIARRFLTTCYRGWLQGTVMHEKYDARVDTGKRGEGGEYKPQTGFGWTNGAVLWLLDKYPNAFDSIAST